MKKSALVISIVLSSLILSACNEVVSPFDSPAEQAIKRGKEGYNYAEEVQMDTGILEGVTEEIGKYVEISKISEFSNDLPVGASSDGIDIRLAKVIDKDGKVYTACFDGCRGILYGLIDTEGNDLVPHDDQVIWNADGPALGGVRE